MNYHERQEISKPGEKCADCHHPAHIRVEYPIISNDGKNAHHVNSCGVHLSSASGQTAWSCRCGSPKLVFTPDARYLPQ